MNSLKKDKVLPLLNFDGYPGVPLLNLKGVPGRNFILWGGPGVLVPLLHHAHQTVRREEKIINTS